MTKKEKNATAMNEISRKGYWYCKNVFPTKKNFFRKIEQWSGFRLHEITSFQKFVTLMYKPTNAASLGVVRALFGLCMVLDVVEERGMADIDLKWGDPYSCYFPLIHGMEPPSLPWMIFLYTLMWIGAFGIMFGFYFKLASVCFIIPYWYIFVLDKSFWNNHSYLYGIVALLLSTTSANRYFSLDAHLSENNTETKVTVHLWNYFILRFQFFALYLLAGLKKSSREWLEGYAMTNLSQHWVFDPFKIFLTTEQTDFLIVHWFGFIFDLTVGFWMLFDKSRIPAMIFCTAFHLMNSRLFSIGMFPWVCLATMPLFCHEDWPIKFVRNFKLIINNQKILLNSLIKNKTYTRKHINEIDNKGTALKVHNDITEYGKLKISKAENKDNDGITNIVNEVLENTEISYKLNEKDLVKINYAKNYHNNENENKLMEVYKTPTKILPEDGKSTKKQNFVVTLLLIHIFLQLFLPYSHFLTKGYNNWVPGLYGYSWDMMVHTWDTILIVVRVHDNENNKDHFVDPQAWVQNDKWSKHGDMVIQYAQCLKDNLLKRKAEILRTYKHPAEVREWSQLSSNLSIYIDVRCSLNGRFQQRIFNPNVDMLSVDWHPFKPVSFLVPLLTQLSSYRQKMDEITNDVYTWSNYTDVLFIADYPGTQLENYFGDDFTNITLTIIEGEVTYAEEDWKEKVTVKMDHSVPVTNGKLHQITTTSSVPSCYMYTYTNRTREQLEVSGVHEYPKLRKGFHIMKEIRYKVNAWWRAVGHIAKAFFYIVYDVPMIRRIPRAFDYHEDY